jgi:hypothetical protein
VARVGGPIASAWNVRLWPTFIILDARGIIRAHGVLSDKQISKMVDLLLAEVERNSPRPTDSK